MRKRPRAPDDREHVGRLIASGLDAEAFDEGVERRSFGPRPLLLALALLQGCAASATPSPDPRPGRSDVPPVSVATTGAPPAPPVHAGHSGDADVGPRCAPIPGIEQLSIVGGRPVAVSPEGLLALDEPGATPLRGAGWPLRPSTPSPDEVPAPSRFSVDVRGDSLDGAVLLMIDAFPDPDVVPRRNEVHRLRRGAWTRETPPPRTSFLDVDVSGDHAVAIAWGGRSSPSTLVALGGSGGAQGKPGPLASSAPPGVDCAPGGPISLALAKNGLVAAIRAGCEGRREWVEIVDASRGSLRHVRLEEPRGSWVALAWLGGGSLLAVAEAPDDPLPKRTLHKIDGTAARRFEGLSLDARSTLSSGANGSVVVTTDASYIVVDASGRLSDSRPWPASLGLRTLGSRSAARVARGRDGALYVELRDDSPQVVRCPPP